MNWPFLRLWPLLKTLQAASTGWPDLFLKNRPGRPVQVAYRVFNRDQSLRGGQFICILHMVDLIFETIWFYHSSGATPARVMLG